MENASPCRHHFYILTNCQYKVIIPQFQKNLINFQGISAPFFQCLFDIFPKSHSIQLSIHKSKLALINPRGYHLHLVRISWHLSEYCQYIFEMAYIHLQTFPSIPLYIPLTFSLIHDYRKNTIFY